MIIHRDKSVRSIAALIAAAVGLGGLAITSGASASATPQGAALPALLSAAAPTVNAPPGWTVTSSAGVTQLTWTTGTAVRGNSQVRFFLADQALPGLPRPSRDGRSFRLDLPTGSLTDLADLQVRAGGRRLDSAGVAALRSSRQQQTAVPQAAALPAATVDPGVAGKYSTVTGEYKLADVKLPDYPQPVEMQAVVVAPKGATGKRPLALFLHGRHSICYGSDTAEEAWPCPAGTKPIPSYRGYLRAQKLLASQGYVTVSISANGINGQDFASEDGGAQARSSLIRLHLAQWADWAGDGRGAAPGIVQTAPPADLSQVLLMGHSRGGDGVNRAAIDSLSPPPSAADGYHGPVRWKIRGTLLLAPTLFGHDPAADVPSVVVLPGCDGDVYDLQGQFSVDGTRLVGTGTALHSAAFVVGANHNYFNSEWTPGLAAAPAWDDWFDPGDKVCGTAKKSLRLTPVQQQKVGATYIAAAARLFVQQDDRVLPLLDGSGVAAKSVKPARVLSHAVGAARVPFVLPSAGLKLAAAGKTKIRLCRQVSMGKKACINPGTFVTVPHFVSFFGVPEEPDRYAVELKWSKAGSAAKLQPRQPVSLAKSKALSLRVFVPTNSPAKKFDVAITDSRGKSATLGRVSITGLPGTEQTVGAWGQELRVSLKAAAKAKLNLNRITRLQLIPRSGSGQAWLLDAWGWRTGTPAVKVAPTSRIDVGTLGVVEETDAPAVYRMPVTVAGDKGGQIRVYISNWMTGVTKTKLITVKPGTHRVSVALTVPGDTDFGSGGFYAVLAETVKGTVVGDYVGTLEVTEDDPAPTVSVTPIADNVTEGKTMSWKLKLSKPAKVDLIVPLIFVKPSGHEMTTTDVPAAWVSDVLGIDRLPSRPLSTTDSFLQAYLAPGETSVVFKMPTAKDTRTEGAEQVRFQVQPLTEPKPTDPPLLEFSGTVND
jgi:hypothetical protein